MVGVLYHLCRSLNFTLGEKTCCIDGSAGAVEDKSSKVSVEAKSEEAALFYQWLPSSDSRTKRFECSETWIY